MSTYLFLFGCALLLVLDVAGGPDAKPDPCVCQCACQTDTTLPKQQPAKD